MNISSTDYIDTDNICSLCGLLQARVARSPGAIAYQYYQQEHKQWRSLSWADTAVEVARWQKLLLGEGLQKGDRVAILLRNCPQWIQFEQAALGLGLVVVPLYVEDRADNMAYVLEDAAVKVLLVQDAMRWNPLAEALSKDARLQTVLILAGGTAEQAPGVRIKPVAEWLPRGDSGDFASSECDADELATIVYTSGTTGRPKGVMLSHANILHNTRASSKAVTVFPTDHFLSFLPLSHMLERTGGYYLPMLAGARVSYARSVQTLADDLMSLQPTVLISVPRVFERVYARIQEALDKGSALKRLLMRLTQRVGWLRFCNTTHPLRILWPLLERLVAEKVRTRMGGRMRIAVTGGAPISQPVARFFLSLNIELLQGYGLTETSPVISVNTPGRNRPDSVGPALPGVETRIGKQQELLVRSPCNTLGYWNNHSATAELIDQEGWLHTGDQARIEDGFIYITGRIKDILVLSNGEKVPPGDMENALNMDPLFESALILGEGQAYLGALLSLNHEAWQDLASELGVDMEQGLGDDRVHRYLLKRIAGRLNDFPGYAKVRRVSLTLEPWTVDNGLLTPTLKLKRARVCEQYAEPIRQLFNA